VDLSAFGLPPNFLSRLHPGKGAINTQAFYNETNQENASDQMDAGLSPEEIISWLEANDTQGDNSGRQYGIVDLDEDSNPRSAAYTGDNCLDYKGHITGINYAIQGNILLNATVLSNMENNFNSSEGSLADKLMAAMQGANIPGADSRCLADGVSSLFAFLVVAKADDTDGDYYLNLGVPSAPTGVDPIDLLQNQFNDWKASLAIDNNIQNSFQIYPNPANDEIHITGYAAEKSLFQYKLHQYNGQICLQNEEILSGNFDLKINTQKLAPGSYYIHIVNGKESSEFHTITIQ
jgi:uncharacterized Ntn-hydrolase superfamily protein